MKLTEKKTHCSLFDSIVGVLQPAELGLLTTFCSHSLAGSVNIYWSVQVQRLELRKLL